MSIVTRLKRLWHLSDAPQPDKIVTDEKTKRDGLSAHMVDYANVAYWPQKAKIKTFSLPKPLPGVLPADIGKMAMDDAVQPIYEYIGYLNGQQGWGEGLGFPGYSYLAELTQRPEYRRPSEAIAKAMTRKWMRIISTGDDDGNVARQMKALKDRYRETDPSDTETIDEIKLEWQRLLESSERDGASRKAEKIKAIEAEFKRLGVQKLFREAAEQDGWYGRAQIWLETCDPDDNAELKTQLVADPRKIGIGGLKSIRLVEAMWTYPGNYDAVNPLRPDYFKPSTWYVMGREVHSTRLLTFISRPLPDILKPAYQFGGLSLSQMLKPYVDNWLRTRQSVSNAISNFSIMLLSVDMAQLLQSGMGDVSGIVNRAAVFNALRDNNGLMIADKNTEDLKNVSMPLGSLDKLQAQSQEHMSAVTGLPLIEAFGITPSGLNASSEGELKVFNDRVESYQEAMFTPNMEYLLKITQISLFGEIDPEIGHLWEPLWTLNELEVANARKLEADIACQYIDRGVLLPEEERKRVANDEDSPYAGLDLDLDIPNPQQDDDDMEAVSKLLTAQSKEQKVEGEENGTVPEQA